MSEPVLQIFNPEKKLKISTDASGYAIGAVLLQTTYEGQFLPVEYASCALTECEQRYAPIEKEMLGIVFGCEKFRQYVCGTEFTVETDHKPLTAISQKELSKVTPRLQRMLMRLQPYNPTVIYTPGKHMSFADPLSRMTNGNSGYSFPEPECHANHMLMVNEIASETVMHRVKQETARDAVLSKLITMIQQG